MTDLIPTSKLTTWENEPNVHDLKTNLDDASIDQQEHLTKVKVWLDNLYMTGAAKPKKVAGRSSVAPKLIRKQAEWRYAPLSEPFLNSPDVFDVTPKTAGDAKRAAQNTLLLNHQFNTYIDKVALVDAIVRDNVDIGTVIAKTGWITEEAEVTEEVPVYEFIPSNDEMLLKQYLALFEMRETNKDLYAEVGNPGLDQALDLLIQRQQLVVPQQVGTEEITSIKEVKNYPTVEICLPDNIIIDPSCDGDIDKAEFIGERFKTNMSTLKKDTRYKNLDKVNVEGHSPLTDPDLDEGPDAQSFTFSDKPRKQFVVHSYWGNWDIYNTGITEPICAFWVGEVMIRLEKNPFPDRKPPFSKSVNMPVRKSAWGEPDGELLIENQQTIGATTRGMIDLLAKSANSQTAFKAGALDTTNRRRFRRGEDFDVNTSESPGNAMFMNKYPEIPASAFNLISMNQNEADSTSGVKAYHSGISGAALGGSVRNGRSALDAASKREVALLRRLSSLMVQIGRKIVSMNAEFLSDEEVIRVTNKKFINVRRDDLAGNFDLALTISTAEEDDRKAEELAFMAQTAGPNTDPGELRLIRGKIARLRKMPELAEMIENYKPEPDPMQQMQAQLQVKLLEAQVAKEQALAMKHASEAELNGVQGMKELTQAKFNAAKADTEVAKARNLGSTSDLNDLKFLEQESGVNQAREKEKIDLKAQHDKEANLIQRNTPNE